MSNHVIIAGTGRAGTSFLVQYLAGCGLETHLTTNPDERLDENANAGLEDAPIAGYALPYVVKSPWLYEVVNDLVERTDITLDAVILPMRDIVEAATSRVILEMRARYSKEYLDPEIARWETWGETPGGIVYSLNPVDQARILALGFHETVRALVKKDIPIIFLDFPRLVEEREYLWEKLEPILRSRIDKESAISVHARIADTQKVRVGKETRASATATGSENSLEEVSKPRVSYPSHDTLDRAALLRELTRLRNQLNAASSDIARLENEATSATALAEETSRTSESLRSQLDEAVQQSVTTKAHAQSEIERRDKEFITRIAMLERSIRELRESASWRVTHPLRTIAEWIRRT